MYLISFLINKPAIYRKILFAIIDILIFFLSSITTFIILSPNKLTISNTNFITTYFLLFPITTSFIYIFTGQYQSLTRFIGSTYLYLQSIRNILVIISIAFISNLTNSPLVSNKYLLIFFILNTGLGAFSRFFIRDILFSVYKENSNPLPRIAIYGAGAAGVKLYNTLRYSRKKNVVAFIDDSKNLENRKINNIKIYSPKSLEKLSPKIDQILLAIPSAKKERIKEILNFLEKFSTPVFKVPSFEDITSGRIKIDEITPISVEDLLGREIIEPNTSLMKEAIKDQTVCITGAAGSIGTELVSQIISLNPKKIILFDNSEMNLYSLGDKLDNLNCSVNYELVLGNATDYRHLKEIFSRHNISLVYHAAAYKHVPLVEDNPIQGIYNNVFSTYFLCKAAKKYGIKRFTFVSTDKAVRPTNVMGASKRLAELIVIGFADKENEKKDVKEFQSKTIFSMVRFGNVLGSSGSVVPKFQAQISKGDSITLTHENIVRYFMSISEAVQLVIQSSSIAKGGEVFLLDMGEPILIKDIAKKLIQLSGKTVKTAENPNGDIEIITTGLRPGEKLHEELLVDYGASPTKHPLIYKVKEKVYLNFNFWEKLKLMKEEIDNNESKSTIHYLSEFVPEWKISQHLKDNLLL